MLPHFTAKCKGVRPWQSKELTMDLTSFTYSSISSKNGEKFQLSYTRKWRQVNSPTRLYKYHKTYNTFFFFVKCFSSSLNMKGVVSGLARIAYEKRDNGS